MAAQQHADPAADAAAAPALPGPAAGAGEEEEGGAGAGAAVDEALPPSPAERAASANGAGGAESPVSPTSPGCDSGGPVSPEFRPAASIGYDASPPSPAELSAMAELRAELAPELATVPQHPELVGDWKMLRFLRGWKKLPDAAKAYRAMVAYREQRGVEEVRQELASSPPDKMVWPYYMPQFAPLLEKAWEGRAPAFHSRGHQDRNGNEVTVTVFKTYNYNAIIAAGLQELWLRMAMYCDVYFDLLLQARSEETGRLIARHDLVDCEAVQMSSVGPQAMQLINRMGESSQHYPELICRTSAINFGTVALALWKLCRPILPKQTAEKFAAEGGQFDLTTMVDPGSLPRRLRGRCDSADCRLVDEHTRQCYVAAKKELTAACPVAGAGELRWEVHVHAHDVDLAVDFAPDGGAAAVALRAKARAAGTVAGTFTPPGPGEVRLQFGNTYSRMRGKTSSWRVWAACTPAEVEARR